MNTNSKSLLSNRILFLDFDGVLNTYKFVPRKEKTPVPRWALEQDWTFSWVDPEKIACLAPLLRHNDFRIVISSTWRHHWDQKSLGRILNEGCKGLGDRIIGVTPTAGFRGEEIDRWVVRNGFEGAYAIMDDDATMLPYQKQYFVHTNPMVGVQSSHVVEVERLLRYEDLRTS